MIDKRLGVTDQILAELRRMKEEQDANVSQMIWFLYHAGLPKPGALIALRRASVMPVEETKLAVHTHEAYADRRAADEAFEDSVIEGIRSLEENERVAAA